jgi:hypothetical protein
MRPGESYDLVVMRAHKPAEKQKSPKGVKNLKGMFWYDKNFFLGGSASKASALPSLEKLKQYYSKCRNIKNLLG